MMTCTSVLTATSIESFEEPALRSKHDTLRPRKPLNKRRHSSYVPQQLSVDTDDIQILVDRFLGELGKRLEFLDCYGHLKFDAGIERAYNTLHTIHESCTHVSDEVIDASWRRARVFVQVIEEQYQYALASRQTMEQKVREGIRLSENILAEFETKAYAIKDATIGTVASDLYETGWRTVDESVHRAAELVDEGLEKARQAKDALRGKVDAALQIARKKGLIAYHELPEPWRLSLIHI